MSFFKKDEGDVKKILDRLTVLEEKIDALIETYNSRGNRGDFRHQNQNAFRNNPGSGPQRHGGAPGQQYNNRPQRGPAPGRYNGGGGRRHDRHSGPRPFYAKGSGPQQQQGGPAPSAPAPAPTPVREVREPEVPDQTA